VRAADEGLGARARWQGPDARLDDADLPNAVGGALWGGFANAGQTCAGIERVYVMREVADRL
jgi:aldehyde dehydrogenase (NAD+)